jgi:hypothetical protein
MNYPNVKKYVTRRYNVCLVEKKVGHDGIATAVHGRQVTVAYEVV